MRYGKPSMMKEWDTGTAEGSVVGYTTPSPTTVYVRRCILGNVCWAGIHNMMRWLGDTNHQILQPNGRLFIQIHLALIKNGLRELHIIIIIRARTPLVAYELMEIDYTLYRIWEHSIQYWRQCTVHLSRLSVGYFCLYCLYLTPPPHLPTEPQDPR